MSDVTPAWVWLDLETTGLSLARDQILEVGVMVTDYDLNLLDPIEPGLSLVVRQPESVLAGMNEFVRDMHTKSGLLDEVRAAQFSLAQVEQIVINYLGRLGVPRASRASLCGNSIHFDRAFMRLHMLGLDGYLNYRQIDVSSVKLLAQAWRPDVAASAPPKTKGHRVLTDIAESIAELRHYRKAWLV